MNILVLTSKHHICSENPLGSVHSLLTSLKLNNVNLYFTGVCEMLKYSDVIVTLNDIVAVGKKVDYIIVCYCNIPVSTTCRSIQEEPYFSKLLEIDRWDKTVYIDYFEYSWRNQYMPKEPYHHIFFKDKCKLYFKRECYPIHIRTGMIPIPLSYVPEEKLDYTREDKIYDIFCCFGQNSTGLRREVVQMCRKLNKKYKVLIAHGIPREKYLQFIRQSWITIDSKGAGYINHRFLEIIANRSMCFRERYPIIFHNDYSDLVQEYSTVQELKRKLKEQLKSVETIENTERLAYKHYLSNHTAEKIGEYILSKLV